VTSSVKSNRATRHRDLLLIVLGIATGTTDAIAVERLGHVFASVITGNLILLGVSAVQGDGSAVVFAACALGGYALGVVLAAPRGEQPQRLWPASATLAFGFELALLGAFTAGWELTRDRPGRGVQLLLLVLAAASMGVQSTAVRRLGHMSTTYLTSTFTGLLEALRRRQWPEGQSRSAGILAAALAGAAAATALLLHARAWVPVLQLVPVAVVVLSSRRLIREEPVSP
jgi:uncharacterized membrane protein YoaK (UPF0700 family)